MDTIDTQSCSDVAFKYNCKICDYNINKKSSYDKHLLTSKHVDKYKKIQEDAKMLANVANGSYKCICDKVFKYHSGIWRHKKTCISLGKKSPEVPTSDISDKEIIKMLIHENTEFKSLILEILKKETTNITTNCNNTNNSHNKTFNLQIFLNEECKDALNISEFVSSIKVELEDLEATGRLGYVEGVSRIMNKNLKELDINKRPIHCSDLKREVLYIKNNDQWTKEEEEKPILKKAIKQVAFENIKKIGEWKQKHPGCTDSESRKNDLYLNIVGNAMSGSTTEEQVKNINKIISKVAKDAVIAKE
jgi:hypothetical protein